MNASPPSLAGWIFNRVRGRRDSPGMKAPLLVCIVAGVFTAHLGALMLLSHLRPQPKLAPRPKDNFSMKAAAFTDSHTGEKLIYQEFTVSTRLAPQETTPPPEKPQVERLQKR
jgi:hypothetical protein